MSDDRPGLTEPLVAFVAATAVAALLALVGMAVPFVRNNLHVVIAVTFFYAPSLASRLSKRPFDYDSAGLRLSPVRLSAAVLGVAVAVAFPLFVVGFFGFYGVACGPHAGPLGTWFGPLCAHWVGWKGGALTLPPNFAVQALNQLVVVAIPEEMFFRGYLLGRLSERWPPQRRLFGAKVGWALLASSALFALGHLAVVPNPQRLAVFFPALLFGWMRARTGSIAAGAAFHALCNLLSDVLHTSYFR